jgi:2-polyprenyl-3-methyl-5-hydroxy-6-metoxy-1,4-benzoquinol methylase
MIAEFPDPARIYDEFQAFERAFALRTALELDLFTQIDSGAQSVPALAEKCGAAERGMRILCDYLTVRGHLRKQDGLYSLTVNSRLYLSRNSELFLGSGAGFLTSDAMVSAFSRLTEAVRAGGAVNSQVLLPDAECWLDFARAMAPLAGPVAQSAAAVLTAKSSAPVDVLDVAAGHGLYGLAIAALNPAAEIFALDWPNVLEIALENAQLAGVAERYHLMPGDAFDVEFGGPYDLVIVANFAHHFDAAVNTAFFRKCRTALKPAGRLALIDFIPDDDRISPAPDAGFALTMLATTAAGDAYTFGDFSGMLRDAGFSEVHDAHWLITASV